jgi:hypothetical protein
VLNELLNEMHELQCRANEKPVNRIMREYKEKHIIECNGVCEFGGDPYYVPFFATHGKRGKDGETTEAYRIKCNGELDRTAQTIVCETSAPTDPYDADDYDWCLLPPKNENKEEK